MPELADARFRVLGRGWHSLALEADGRLVFKFPRSREAQEALLREASLLSVIRPDIALDVPQMRIHRGPPLFSCHRKLPGAHLLPEGYAALSESRRQRLGDVLGRFYADLHRLDITRMREAGAVAVEAWQSVASVRAKALTRLPADLRRAAGPVVAAFEALAPDPLGETFGFFDGHGWNMAFDRRRGMLNGIYDFADAGIGPVHQDFIYSNFISSDLTGRIITAYQERTGRRIDRRRVDLLTAYHRLSELAQVEGDESLLGEMIGHVRAWLRRPGAGESGGR